MPPGGARAKKPAALHALAALLAAAAAAPVAPVASPTANHQSASLLTPTPHWSTVRHSFLDVAGNATRVPFREFVSAMVKASQDHEHYRHGANHKVHHCNAFYAVESGAAMGDRRAAVRSTWMTRLPDPDCAKFFVMPPRDGSNDTIPDEGNADVVVLHDLSGSHTDFTAKMSAIIDYVYRHFDSKYLVHTDDDVYLCADLMEDLLHRMPEHRLKWGGFKAGVSRFTSVDKYALGFGIVPWPLNSVCSDANTMILSKDIALGHMLEYPRLFLGRWWDRTVARTLEGRRIHLVRDRTFYHGYLTMSNVPQFGCKRGYTSTHRAHPKEMQELFAADAADGLFADPLLIGSQVDRESPGTCGSGHNCCTDPIVEHAPLSWGPWYNSKPRPMVNSIKQVCAGSSDPKSGCAMDDQACVPFAATNPDAWSLDDFFEYQGGAGPTPSGSPQIVLIVTSGQDQAAAARRQVLRDEWRASPGLAWRFVVVANGTWTTNESDVLVLVDNPVAFVGDSGDTSDPADDRRWQSMGADSERIVAGIQWAAQTYPDAQFVARSRDTLFVSGEGLLAFAKRVLDKDGRAPGNVVAGQIWSCEGLSPDPSEIHGPIPAEGFNLIAMRTAFEFATAWPPFYADRFELMLARYLHPRLYVFLHDDRMLVQPGPSSRNDSLADRYQSDQCADLPVVLPIEDDSDASRVHEYAAARRKACQGREACKRPIGNPCPLPILAPSLHRPHGHVSPKRYRDDLCDWAAQQQPK